MSILGRYIAQCLVPPKEIRPPPPPPAQRHRTSPPRPKYPAQDCSHRTAPSLMRQIFHEFLKSRDFRQVK